MEDKRLQFSLLALFIVVTIAAVAVRFWEATVILVVTPMVFWIPIIPVVVPLAILLPLWRRRMRRRRQIDSLPRHSYHSPASPTPLPRETGDDW